MANDILFLMELCSGKGAWLKDIELRLICELVKNSRRSDRELAKALRTSQPTVSRTIKKLEKEGYIKEYTAVPNFSKLGFQIMAFTLIKLKEGIPNNMIEKKREEISEISEGKPYADLLALTGMGLGADRILVTYHENFHHMPNS